MKLKLEHLILTGLLVAIGVILSQILSISYPPSSTILKFGIGYVPLILVSIFFGPVVGGFAGIVQDILGYFLFGTGGGVFFPGFTLNAILYGVLPSLLYRFRPAKGERSYLFINLGFGLVATGLTIWFAFDRTLLSANSDFTDFYRILLIVLSLFVLVVVTSAPLLWMKRLQQSEFQRIYFLVQVLYVLVSLILTPLWLTMMYSGTAFWAFLPIRIVKMPIETVLYTIILERLIRLRHHYQNVE
ncbi:MAG: folate family ECF transporter S component [Candidatus Izemoplasmatales bacterium]